MKPVRVSAKAVIIRNQKILAIKHETASDEWYGLPGGGQENGESLTDALIRECMEEMNVKVIARDVLFIRDYIARNHEFSSFEGDTHQIEIMFDCAIGEGEAPVTGSIPDSTQKDVVWLEIKDLSENRFYPKELIPYLQRKIKDKIYLGDIN